MKKLALVVTAVVGLCAVSAEAQSDATTTTTRTSRKARQTTTVTTRNSTTLTQRLRRIEANARPVTATTPTTRIDGSVARVVRSNNPLQMVNPFAPKEYGDGSDVTRREPEDPYQRPEGLRLFAFEF